MAQKQAPKGRGLWILLMILLTLWNLGALTVGGVLRIVSGLRGKVAELSSQTESSAETTNPSQYRPWDTTETATFANSGTAVFWSPEQTTDTTEPDSVNTSDTAASAQSSETAAAPSETAAPQTAPPAAPQANPPAAPQTAPPATPQTEVPVITPPTDAPGIPTPGDFTWYGTSPAGVTYLDFYESLGTWKGMIVYDESSKDMVNVLLDIGQSGDILVTIDWYQLVINGEPPVDETGYEDAVYTGYQWGNGILVSGLGDLEITEFYSDGTCQYATGTLTYNGAVYPVALVR